jgi:hypothetical protein
LLTRLGDYVKRGFFGVVDTGGFTGSELLVKRPIRSKPTKNLETAHAPMSFERRAIVDQDLNALALGIEEHVFGRGARPFRFSLPIDGLHGITQNCRRSSGRIAALVTFRDAIRPVSAFTIFVQKTTYFCTNKRDLKTVVISAAEP